MFFSSGASALALFSLAQYAHGQSTDTLDQACQYTASWAPCQGDQTVVAGFECATIKVAYDWATYNQNDPNRKEIDLKLIRLPASVGDKNTAKSIIINPGGPGISGINTVLTGGAGMQT